MNNPTRTAIVTGGTGALGNIVTQSLLQSGMNVAIPVRSRKSFSEEAESKKLFTAQADLTKEADVRSFVALVQKQFGTVDCLINLAGGYAGGNPIAEVSLDEWESMMSLNLRTTFLMCREVLKSMIASKAGRIINISAMPAILSGAKKGPYAISKRAVISLTETIADEVKGSGITANAIAPSIILTDANKTSMPAADVQKWVTPEEIAGVILFLCSDEARSINGNTIKVFGGV